jgi:hypothetical protein
MRLPREAYPMLSAVETELGHLTGPQQRGLVWWVFGTVVAGSACQRAVVSALEPLVGAAGVAAVRQRLREWLLDGAEKAVPGRTELDVATCFAPLLRWVVRWWQGTTVPLALDATLLHDRVVVLSIGVVYRGCAIPVAWHVTAANRKGAWLAPICALIAALAPAVPPTLTVVLLTDRGLWSPRIWQAACAAGWHPLMRIRQAATFRPIGGERVAAAGLVPGPGHAWVGPGMAYKPSKRRAATLIAVWEEGHAEPCLVLTDLLPEAVGVCWYGLRAWIEAGFRVLKSLGWHWERTRRTAPHRVARHWLVLAVATLWTLATGTRVEDAARLGREPAHLRVALPPPPGVVARTVSVFARGLARLRWQLLRGRRLWTRLWLWPDPLPPTAAAVAIAIHAPPSLP